MRNIENTSPNQIQRLREESKKERKASRKYNWDNNMKNPC